MTIAAFYFECHDISHVFCGSFLDKVLYFFNTQNKKKVFTSVTRTDAFISCRDDDMMNCVHTRYILELSVKKFGVSWK